MANYFNKANHDIRITDPTTSDTLGFVLSRDPETGAPDYAVYDSKYLADQYFTGQPSIVNMNPEEEIPLVMGDWRGGFGQEVFDNNDDKRYWSSIGMDLRHKGMAIAGPTPTAVALPVNTNVPTIVNPGMELGTAVGTFGWDLSPAYASQSTSQKDAGTYSLKLASTGSDITTGQYIVGWTPGVQYTFTGKSYPTNNLSPCYVGIDDGVSITWSTANSTQDTWTQQSHQKTLSANALYCRLLFKLEDGSGGDGYFDTTSITMDSAAGAGAFSGVTRAEAEYNGDHFFSLDKTLMKIQASDGLMYAVRTFPANITDIVTFPDDKLYIAQGTSAAYYEMNLDHHAIINSASGTATYQFFVVVHAATPVIWGNDGTNTIRSNTDPSETGANAWSGTTTVGSSYHSITDLETKAGALYIGKEDMLYYLDSSSNVQNDLAPELETVTSSTSCKNMHVWQNKLYIPAGTQVLLEVDGSTLTYINPSKYCTGLPEFVGRVQALAHDEEWLYAFIDNSTEVEVLAGRWETIDGTTAWRWHPIAETTLTDCETAFTSSVYQKRSYVASTSSSDSLYHKPLPTGYGDITNDANRLFKTDTYFVLSALHGGFKSDNKAYYKATATLGHAHDALIYYELHYKKLGDAAWRDTGDFIGTSTDRKPVLYIIDDASGNSPVSTQMWFKLVAKTDDTNKTPILLNFDVRAILYPVRRDVIFCRVRVGKEVLDKNGLIIKDKYQLQKDCLDNIRDGTWMITVRDIDGAQTGTDRYFKPLPLSRDIPWCVPVKQEKGRDIEWEYTLALLEVHLS